MTAARPIERSGLSGRTIVGYSLGSFGTGVFTTVPSVLLLYYCTEILRVSPWWAAVALFVPKAWGIVADPAIGAWSDRFRSPLGRRAPFLLAGAVGVPLAFVLLFHLNGSSQASTFLLVTGAYFLMATAYSLFAVPYLAVVPEISDEPAERERLLVWRMAFAMTGVLLGAGAAPHLVALGGGGRQGYAAMSIIIALICGGAMLVAFATTLRTNRSTPASVPSGRLRDLLSDGMFVRLALVYLLQLTGVGLVSALAPYFVVQTLGLTEADTGTALGSMLLATIMSLPLWSKLMRRFGGWRALALAGGSYMIVCLCLTRLGAGPSQWELAGAFALLGLPFGGIQLIPFTMLAHLTHEASRRAGSREGLYTGMWTATEKLGLALGPAAAGMALAWARSMTASLGAGEPIRLVMAAGPALFLLAGLVAMPWSTNPVGVRAR